jgi:hypothetical protein
VILDPRISAFVEWFAEFQLRFGTTLDSMLVPAEVDFHVPLAMNAFGGNDEASRAIARALAAAELAHRLENGIDPVLASLRSALEVSAERIAEGMGIEAYLEQLRTTVSELPEVLELTDRHEDGESVVTVPLRSWLEAMVVEPAEPAMADALVAAARENAIAIQDLDRLQKVLDYYLLAVQRHTGDGDQPNLIEEFAQAGLARTRALLDQFRARRRAGALRVRALFVRRMSGALEDACGPLRALRAGDIMRQLETMAEAARDRDAPPPSWRVWRDRMLAFYGRTTPVLREVARDLRLLFANEELPRDDSHRQLVTVPLEQLGNQLPASYRRLFVGVPTEIADIYVPRPAIEVQCRIAIDGWLRGGGNSLLLSGDRGAGKRTVVNQVLAALRNDVPVHWVRLSRDVHSEADVCRTIGRELEISAPIATFAALERELRSLRGRRALVIENSERLFRRSPSGLARTASFLELIAGSGPSTLWIVLMATPAAGVIGNALDLGTRMTAVVQVNGLVDDDLRAVLLQRHVLAGYELHFAPGTPRALEQVRRPLASMRARRDPESAYFERLGTLTGGNPRQALYYWLRTVMLDAERDRVVVQPLPERASPLLSGIPIGQRMALALIAQYGSLTVEDLAEALGGTADRATSDLRALCSVGWVARAPGIHEHWSLSPVSAHPLTLELREHNMV